MLDEKKGIFFDTYSESELILIWINWIWGYIDETVQVETEQNIKTMQHYDTIQNIILVMDYSSSI